MSKSETFIERSVAFGRALRRAGIATTPGQVMDFVRAVEHIDISERAEFREAGRACLITSKEAIPIYDAVFERFWRAKPDFTAQIPDGTPPTVPADELEEAEEVESADDAESTLTEGVQRSQRLELVSAEDDEDQGDVSDETGDNPDDVVAYSAAEILRERDFADLNDAEMAQVRKMMAQLHWQLGRRRSRRKVAAPRGRFIDPRRTMRQSLQTGGVPMSLAHRATKTKPRQLVVICDVSGSMDRYSRVLLQFVHTIENNMARVEAFVFGTRLTRITRLIRRRSIDEAMERVSHEVQDWSGGTRIGQSLQTFNMVWARRVLRNGAVVLIISDGWDRGSPEVLRREMERLQRSSYRLLWLNPLLGSPRYEPLTRGMQAALPYIDDFLPIHNLASLEALARRLSTIDDYRPVRRQHPPLPHPSVPATT